MGGPGGEWRGRGSSRLGRPGQGRELSRGGVAARVDSAPGGEGPGTAAAGLQWGLMARRPPAEAQRRWSLHGRQPGSHLPLGSLQTLGTGPVRWACARGHTAGGCWGGQAGPAPAVSPPARSPSLLHHRQKDELKDGLRVLIPMDDKRCCTAGHVQTCIRQT